jgi:hypothetical protein
VRIAIGTEVGAGGRVTGVVISPTGKSVAFGSLSVQPPLQKYFCSRPTQISSLIRAVSSLRGALAIVTDAGRDAVDAGGARDEGAVADGEVVWF